MTEYIRASVSTVEAFFTQNRVIRLPWFQRAYAWREESVLRLVSDILLAMETGKPGYCLGHIHIAATAEQATASLVDGHQRAITLAMLFAILRDLAASDLSLTSTRRQAEQARLQDLLVVPARVDREIAAAGVSLTWRLSPQPQMAAFFEAFVQQPGGTLVEPDGSVDDLTPAERNLIENRNRLRAALGNSELTAARRMDFTSYLLGRCHFVVVEVDDEDDAWSILGVEQTTRMPHDASEQAKISLIYAMPAVEQEAASRIWEATQAKLGNERISELLGHLRTLRIEKRSTKPLEGDLQTLYGLNNDGLGFMNTVVYPHAEALRRLDGRQVGSGTLAKVIGNHIETLNWLDHRLWVAPALAWLTIRTDQHRATEPFFARLDRLAWMLRLAGTDPNEQENRFIRLAAAVRRDQLITEWPEFEVSDKTRDEALAILRSRTFYYKHTCNRVLRRLSHQLGADPGVIDGVNVSIEHILPRRPAKERQWLRDFASQPGIIDNCDRLGNLALLTGPQNRRADTNDWSIKAGILRSSGFVLSMEAATNANWMPRTIELRTDKLIALLFAPWGIAVAPP